MAEGVAQLEPRVAKIEADVAYISSRVANVEIDLRDLRKSMDARFDATSAELRTIRADMSSEFKSIRADMSSEFKALREDMTGEFRTIRTEMKEDSKDNRTRLDRLGERVWSLQIMVVILGIAVVLVTKGSQSLQAIWQWLSHVK